MSIASPAHAAQYMSVNEAQKHAFPNATGFAEVQAGRVWKAQMPRATAAAPVPTAATLVPADEPAEAILGNVS